MAEYKKVTPYGDGDSKKGQVTKMFDKIAPYYDYLNRFLSLGIDVLWRKKLIGMLKKNNPKRILDVATGTADLAIEAAQNIKPDYVIGMDISKEMLRVGDKKLIKKSLQDVITLEIGDSEQLKYEDGQFDAVTSAFGVRNFENLKAGLKEMYRVLEKGGNMYILEFSRPKTFPIKQIFNGYFKYLLPVIGKIKSKDPKAYQYLYESVQVFPDYDSFTQILKEIGFEKASYKPLSFGICTIYSARK
jgi:demethylmenaquinone methyltransferase/2-methoxy-6-polyprenyl-1,4-benzoquinol methylase